MLNFILPAIVLAASMVLTRWVPHHPRWRPFVIAANVTFSLRYLWWRATETLNWEGGWGTAISLAAFGAEIYGFLVVLHHYTIATRSLDRTTAPPDAAFSPSVDIFVASYNEGADILTRTLVGCQAIDYANKQVYLLDDGRRPEIAALCERLGVNYIARPDNKGAKAGNLNYARLRTSGDFIVTFDADHVPVSSFLRETLGHFRAPRVAQVQSAHHFFNPDLFQDRLRSHDYIANEQDMFYHIVQPGRDADNASFYCGSGAVFRRAAIDEIGGYPMTTITEDLHTSMLLHSRGWQSVYVNKDLSAGLAPESFEAYLTQRRRWSKGTMQVMLLRGGLTLPNLTWKQRVHYFATLWYWLYGFPRAIYLLSPLFFLLLGVQPLIVKNIGDLGLYYLPHLFISVSSFQLVNRGMRRIFWSDIYESCIAVQLAIASLTFPFSGWKVHFAVTPKGQAANRTAFRRLWKLGWPLMVLYVLLTAGIVSGATSLIMGEGDSASIAVNVFWGTYNLIIVSFGLLLLRTPGQKRADPRLPRQHACRLTWDSVTAEGTSIDLSETGLSLRLAEARPLPPSCEITISSRDGRSVTARARLVRSELRDGAVIAGLQFMNRTPEQHRRLIELMFSAPDSWEVSHGLTMDTPEHVGRIVRSIVDVFARRRALRRLAPRFACDLPVAVTLADGQEMTARATDISHAGVGVTVAGGAVLPEGTTATLTLSWNDYERTTFAVRVANARSEGRQTLLGFRFVRVDKQQENDLFTQLYQAGKVASTERKAA